MLKLPTRIFNQPVIHPLFLVSETQQNWQLSLLSPKYVIFFSASILSETKHGSFWKKRQLPANFVGFHKIWKHKNTRLFFKTQSCQHCVCFWKVLSWPTHLSKVQSFCLRLIAGEAARGHAFCNMMKFIVLNTILWQGFYKDWADLGFHLLAWCWVLHWCYLMLLCKPALGWQLVHLN